MNGLNPWLVAEPLLVLLAVAWLYMRLVLWTARRLARDSWRYELDGAEPAGPSSEGSDVTPW